MQGRTIDSALLALRKQMIRGDGDGLEHVEALLALLAVHAPRVMPAKRQDAAGKGRMAQMVLQGIGEGHSTQRELAAYVANRRPEITPRQAYQRTSQALTKLKARGMVVRDGRVWKLAP